LKKEHTKTISSSAERLKVVLWEETQKRVSAAISVVDMGQLNVFVIIVTIVIFYDCRLMTF